MIKWTFSALKCSILYFIYSHTVQCRHSTAQLLINFSPFKKLTQFPENPLLWDWINLSLTNIYGHNFQFPLLWDWIYLPCMNIYGHNFLKMYSSIVRLNISSSHKHLWTFLENLFLNCEIGNFFLPQTFGHNFLKIYSSIVRLNISSSHKHLWTQFPGNLFLYCKIEYFLLPQTFMDTISR